MRAPARLSASSTRLIAPGMPGDRDVDVVEAAGAHHEGLRGAAFLGRAAVVAHAALDAGLRQIVLHRGRGEQRRRAEQIVAAAMTVAAALDLLRLRDAGDLRQARQRIVFAEDRDHRPALARLAHHGGRNVGDVLGDAEAFLLQHGAMLGDRAVFRVGDLRHAPDAVGQRLVVVLAGIDELPDFFRVLHLISSFIGSPGTRCTLRASIPPPGPGTSCTDSSGPTCPTSISRSGRITMTRVAIRIVMMRAGEARAPSSDQRLNVSKYGDCATPPGTPGSTNAVR